MRGLVLRLLAVIGVLMLAAAPASATRQPAGGDFGDCASPDYLARFDQRFRTVAYDCVERLRLPVATRSGTREIRLLHDLSADWLADEAMLAQFDRGVRLAVEELGRIGAFDMRNVSILLADDFPPRADAETFTTFAAWTLPDATGLEGECQVVIFLLGPGADARDAASVTAHEIFHCVQKANLSPELMTSHTADRKGGTWWMEGSAEWFASAAVPDLSDLQNRVDGFETASPDTPLFHMAYRAVVFFFWFVGERGDAAVLPFLSGMATSSSDSAQAAAMADALSDEEWLAFAEAYLDGEIRRPRGEPVSFAPWQGDTVRWDATRSERRPLRPFVIDRAWLECDCGTWTTAADPDEVHEVRPDGAGWGALPGRIDTRAGDPDAFRLAAFNTDASARDLVLDFTLDIPCEGCGGGELDECLVGRWELTSGGATEWIRREMPAGMGLPRAEYTGGGVTFQADGGYRGGPTDWSATFTQRTRRGTGRLDGEMSAVGSGRWAAEGGRLTMCPAHETVAGQATATLPDGRRVTLPVTPPPPSGPLTMSYSCAGDTVTTTLEIPGARTPMVSTYTRVG